MAQSGINRSLRSTTSLCHLLTKPASIINARSARDQVQLNNGAQQLSTRRQKFIEELLIEVAQQDGPLTPDTVLAYAGVCP